MSEFIIIDDDRNVRYNVRMLVTLQDGLEGLKPVEFETPSEALDYIVRTNARPGAYLCDMRIPKEMDGPKRMFEALKTLGRADNFYFMTGNFSDHDRSVVNMTGAQYTLKDDVPVLLERIAANYAPEQPSATPLPASVRPLAAAAMAR